MSFGKKMFPLKYIILIKDMYDRIITSVRIRGCITHRFPIIRFTSRINIKHIS